MTRVFPLLTGDARILVGAGGGVTILIAGVIALAQPDLKRLLAASTSSQVGFMFLGIAAASPFAALFHLTAHAAMKSALFLGAGIFQHARDTTDLDSLRGIGRGHRRVYLGMVLAGLALVGIPPLAGFWSKEAVIAAAFHAETSWLWGPLVLAGSLLTGMYVARALRILWDGDPDEARVPGINWMSTGLAGLAFLAVTVGLGGPWLSRFLGEELPGSLLSLVLGLGAALAGLVAGWLGSDRVRLGAAFARAGDGFRLDSGFDGLVVRPVLEVAATLDRLDLQIEHRLRGAVRFVSELEARARIEPRLEQAVRGAGARTLMIGRLAAMTDDLGISGLIGQLVHGVRTIGARSRRLQTGLIHRELLVTAGGALIVLVIILLS